MAGVGCRAPHLVGSGRAGALRSELVAVGRQLGVVGVTYGRRRGRAGGHGVTVAVPLMAAAVQG